MKAISIRQPWAYSIIFEDKDIENRSWGSKYRGPLLIHAAQGMTDIEFRFAMDFIDDQIPLDQEQRIARRARASNAPRGGIIGIVDMVDCVTRSDSPWFMGPYGFVFANPRPLPFRPMRGMLGLFEVPE